ncbi:diguanylate cyclase domain-containing protein [Dongia sp. agr-C8]
MSAEAAGLQSDDLMGIIQAQNDIAKLGMDLGAMLTLVVDRIRGLTRAEGAIVEMAEGDEMVYRAASGMAEGQLGLRLQRQGSLSGFCVQSGEILECRDSEGDNRVDREACRRVGLRSMMVAPLVYSGRTIGVLKIAARAPEAFAARDRKVLELMTGLIGAAIYKASDFNDLYYRATHDPLTGIYNRAMLFDRLRQGLLLAARNASPLGVVNLDMDGLKPINDRFGHRAGDAAIRELAVRLRRMCRESDTVARLGGDEFGVVLPDVKSRAGVELQASRISAEIDAPLRFEDQELKLGASLGVAVFPDDGTDAAALIDKADQAMYAAKRARKQGSDSPR